jgi:hypothetical protein
MNTDKLIFKIRKKKPLLITVAARYKAWNVFSRSNTGIVFSNPTRGIDVCLSLFCVCVVLWRSWPCGRADHPASEFYQMSIKTRPHYSCSCYSRYTLRVNIRILTRRSRASNWSSVDEDLRAQVKARRAQTWRAPARARVMWTHL